MRILALMLLISMPVLAHAATPINEKTARAYYQNCINQEAPMMSEDTQKTMCSCTANKMMQNITVEDVQAMSSEQTSIARPAANKVMLDVYAPCIEAPAKDYYFNTCVSNPETANISKQPERLCDCMSSEVAGFLAQNGQGVFADILDRNPTILDPMQALAEDPEFKQFAESKLLGCYTKNR
ncbi:MAG: hypothetical protein AAF569_02860 [Pseudomonadota bacterium]